MNELPEELLNLLAQKSYHELNEPERDLAKQFLSPDEYDEYAALISDFQQMDQELAPTPPQQELPSPAKKASKLYQLFTYRIPAYQAVAATFLALVFFQLASPSQWGSLSDGTQALENDSTMTMPSDFGVQNAGTPLSEDDYPEELIFNL